MVTGDFIFRLCLVVTLAFGPVAALAAIGGHYEPLVAMGIFYTTLLSSWFLLYREPSRR